MIAIFNKEIRANLKWALLAMLGMAILLGAVTHDGANSIAFLNLVLVNPRMQATTAFGFPAIGLILGMLVVFEDFGVGRWAFLTHRPISREKIFTAKFFAAAMLYLLATLPPLLAVAAWASVPGHVAAPFEWKMLIPGLVHLLGGLDWMAAGMLAARQVRSFRRMIFPFGLPILVCLFVESPFVNLAGIVAIHLGLILVLAIAARAAFVAGGEYETRSWPGKLTQNFASTVGIIMALIATVGVSESMVASPADGIYQSYQIDKSGTVFVANTQGQHATYARLDNGSLPTDRIDQSNVNQFYMSRGNRRFPLNRTSPLADEAYANSINWNGQVNWFYMPDERTLVGYDTESRKFIGSMGPDGAAGPQQSPQPFPGDLQFINQSIRIIIRGEANYQLAFSDRFAWQIRTDHNQQVTQIFAAPAGETIIDIGWLFALDGPVIATRQALYVFQDDHIIARLPRTSDPNATAMASIVRLPDGRLFVLHSDAISNREPIGYTWVLVELSPDGRVIRRTELPALDNSSVVRLPLDPFNLVAPPVLVLALSAYSGSAPFTTHNMERMAIGLAAAIVGRLLMRRYSGSRANRWLWTITCLLLGIPGVLLLLCARQPMVRLACPKCGRMRWVGRDDCEYCSAPFNPPEQKGIEVFAPAIAI